MTLRNVTRREVLKLGGATAAAELGALLLHGCGGGTSILPPGPSVCSKLTDIEHVVIFIQENRSFDHYLGAIAECAASRTQVLRSSSQMRRTRRTHRPEYCCHS